MTLIVLLISITCDYLWGKKEAWRQFGWFDKYIAFILSRTRDKFFAQRAWGVLLLLVPLLLIVGIIYYLLAQLLFGLGAMIFAAALLWYCMDLSGVIAKTNYFIAGAQDDNQALERARAMGEPSATSKPIDAPHRHVTQTILWQYHERVFALVFWFCLLGPVGAFLYRMLLEFKQRTLANDALGQYESTLTLCHGILAWVPARLAALSYMLAGNFTPGIYDWLKHLKARGNSCDILVRCGIAALGLTHTHNTSANTQENQDALGLMSRALVIWLFLIALFTIANIQLWG